MSNIFFKPWVGSNYNSGGVLGRKILALGESHYYDGDEEDVYELTEPTNFTTDVVNVYLDVNDPHAGWKNTFKKFERSLVNKETSPEESKAIWNSIIFYNYLQAALSSPRQAVPPELYAKSEAAFFEILEKYRPDEIVCWGTTRLYDKMPSNNWISAPEKIIDGKTIYNGFYVLKDGTKIPVIWINHPSSGYDWTFWNKVIFSI